MVRCLSIFLFGLGTLVPTVTHPAEAGIGLLPSIAIDTRRNNCWPKPFFCPDRRAVRAPFGMMIAKGWQRQNTLGDFHFEQSSGALTESGTLKVRRIVEEVPQPHRAIYVLRAATPDETAARIKAVEEQALGMIRGGELPPILETTMGPGGWPASQVDSIGRKFEDTTPAPRLPDAQPAPTSK